MFKIQLLLLLSYSDSISKFVVGLLFKLVLSSQVESVHNSNW